MGGSIEGPEEDGLYTSLKSYTDGTQLKHGGASNGGMNGEPPARPDNNGEMPKKAPNSDGTQPTPPEKPDGNGDPMGMNNSAEEESSDFVFTRETRNFTNVRYAESATESTKTTAA